MHTSDDPVVFTPQEHQQMALQAYREGRWVSEVLLERLAEKRKAKAEPVDESTATTTTSMT